MLRDLFHLLRRLLGTVWHRLQFLTCFDIIMLNKKAFEGSKKMSTMIICAGKSMSPAVGRYDSAGFDAAIREAAMSVCPPYDGKRFNAEGKTVLIAEGRPALDTAEKILLPCEWSVDELLNEIPLRSFTDTERSFTERQWLKRAAAQRKQGDARQPESDAAAKERADRLVEKLSGGDFILITYPVFLSVLLDRLRVHDYVVQRTGFMRIQPYEWFLISQKEAHCGGCVHNCFLGNPGCGVGRDKAARKGVPYTK